MPRISASRRAQARATVFEFLPALARRFLACRLGSRGTVAVFEASPGVFTVVHQKPGAALGEVIEKRIAQIRASTEGYRLFWKRCNGRWTAYPAEGDAEFAGSFRACLSEIARDRSGCFWS